MSNVLWADAQYHEAHNDEEIQVTGKGNMKGSMTAGLVLCMHHAAAAQRTRL
jgi:hypothetical protein